MLREMRSAWRQHQTPRTGAMGSRCLKTRREKTAAGSATPLLAAPPGRLHSSPRPHPRLRLPHRDSWDTPRCPVPAAMGPRGSVASTAAPRARFLPAPSGSPVRREMRPRGWSRPCGTWDVTMAKASEGCTWSLAVSKQSLQGPKQAARGSLRPWDSRVHVPQASRQVRDGARGHAPSSSSNGRSKCGHVTHPGQ